MDLSQLDCQRRSSPVQHVSSFLPFVVSYFLANFWSSWVRSERHAATPKTGLPHFNAWIWRSFLISPAIKIEIENSLEMALFKAKSGAWQSHFWQSGTLHLLETRSSLHYASKSKLSFVQAASFQLNWQKRPAHAKPDFSWLSDPRNGTWKRTCGISCLRSLAPMWRFAMQHHPGNIHQSFATPRYSATPCYVLIQLPNVIDTISKRWRSKKAFNTSPCHIFS